MDVVGGQIHVASIADDWFARFSPPTGSKPAAFPFTTQKAHSIESRRARMSDLLILDVLLLRGGIRSPDMLFPPADWASLRKLLDAISQSIYDILKKDCLVYILLKWAWDINPPESNSGWDVRYVQDRCIPPQFAALAHAYWLLDTGTHLSKAVSILSDARLNRDYVSKILQALSLSSSPASFASGTAPATAALVVKYIRTAKPLLVEPDDIDLYTLSLAQHSFSDAWAYQRSFPEESSTRERLLGKLVAWCLMPTPKQESLAQLLAFSLSPYEQSLLHSFALPPPLQVSSSLSIVNTHVASPSKPPLSPQAISVLQDLLCVRAIQSGDYVRAIKLDREFSSVSPTLGSDSSSSISSQATLPGRDTIDRKSIIQDLFDALPPAERTLLEDEIGKLATGVRAVPSSTFTPRHGVSASARRPPPTAEASLSASWEDVGAASTDSPVLSTPSSPGAGASSASKKAPTPASMIGGRVNQPMFSTSTPASTSPFAPRVAQLPPFGHQAPPTPKFTAFGSPIPATTGTSTRGVITERGTKTLFSNNATSGSSIPAAKPATRVSLFDTTGSAKNAPNAFYKPPAALATFLSPIGVSSALSSDTVKNVEQDTNAIKQNGKVQRGQSEGEDASMGSGSDVEIIDEGRHDKHEAGKEEKEDELVTDEDDDDDDDANNFLTYDKSGATDFTLHTPHIDEAMMDEDHGAGPELGFSVFSGSRNAVQNGNVRGQVKKRVGENERDPHTSSQRRGRTSPSREGDKSLSASVSSTTANRSRAPPGAFHHEEEDEDEENRHGRNENETEDEEGGHMLQTVPVQPSRRSIHTRRQSETPSRPSIRSQPQRSSKSTAATTGGRDRPSTRSKRTSSRSKLSHTIPGALMDDEDNNEHGQDDADHTDNAHGDADTEIGEQDEQEDDAVAPLPSRSSRRTRTSGSDASIARPKQSGKSAVPTKGKSRARPSDAKTPMRRSSRLSMASSASPEHTDIASPTKARRSTGSRASIAGSGSGATGTRSMRQRR